MATLSVLKFDDPGGAYRVLIALQGMQERQMITLEGATVVSWPEGNKKPKVSQIHGTSDVGAISDAFWGFLIGVIFFVPSLGVGSGALRSPLAEVGIDDDFIGQVRERVTEGTSALFALTSGVTALDEVVAGAGLWLAHRGPPHDALDLLPDLLAHVRSSLELRCPNILRHHASCGG